MSEARPIQRVLYVVSLFPCWSETFIVREIRTLLADGVDVRIISLKPPSETLVQADAKALLERVSYPGHFVASSVSAAAAMVRRPLATLGCVGALVADMWRTPTILLKSLVGLARGMQHLGSIRQFDPQLIHAHWATYPSTAAWALARIGGYRFSFTCHAHDIFVDRQLLARKIRDADLAVTISRFNIGWLAQHASAQATGKCKVIHCGVDLQRTQWALDGRDPRRIVAVGRLDPIKGFDVLIDALHLLDRRGVDYRCTVIGEGPLRAALETQAQRRGIGDRLALVGALPQEAVQAALRDAAIFALPCQVADDGNRDGIPVALMEAMASGCCVVTTAVSGIPELVEDCVNGLLVGERDPVALADALQRLLHDASLRTELAIAARQRVEQQFDAQREARTLRQRMSEAVDPRWTPVEHEAHRLGRSDNHPDSTVPIPPTARCDNATPAGSPGAGVRRLLVVIDEMEVGGSQRQVAHLLLGLDRSRWQPELAYFRERSFLVDTLEQAGVRVHHLPKHSRIDLRFLVGLWRLLRDGRYDAVHAFSLTAEFWTLLALRLQRRPPPLIASVRGLYLHQSVQFWRIKRHILSRCAAVISNSRAGADIASRYGGMARTAFDVIGNGVPIPTPATAAARAALRARIGVPSGRAFALFVGRLVVTKNVACLLDALATLPPGQRPWLALAGDGPLHARLRDHAGALGISADVAFLGERDDTCALMQAADFLILPSREEGLSNALLEAMAAGCPVIASRVGGNPELVEDGVTGLLFPDNDSPALAQSMRRLTCDPALRDLLSQQALAHAQCHHSITALVAATQVVYERCIDPCRHAATAADPVLAPHPSTESDNA